jgi:hypothetical protein
VAVKVEKERCRGKRDAAISGAGFVLAGAAYAFTAALPLQLLQLVQ